MQHPQLIVNIDLYLSGPKAQPTHTVGVIMRGVYQPEILITYYIKLLLMFMKEHLVLFG